MSKIFIGRAGEELHEFSFYDVMNGAVRDEGLFPELYESAWPAVTSGALVTGVDKKLQEHRMAVRYDQASFSLQLPGALLPQAMEDSDEAEATQVDIALNKVHKSFVGPVRSHAAGLPKNQQKVFLEEIAARARVVDARHIIAIGDDRNSIMDSRLKDPLYGDLSGHWNDQVREVHSAGHLIPGKRVKETDGAHYGVPNSVFLLEKAVADLNREGEDVEMFRRMDTTLCFMPLIQGDMPLPEKGLIIRAETDRQLMRAITDEYRTMIKKGRILTYDHFNGASGYGLKPGVVTNDLLKLQEGPYVDVHPFLAEQHSPIVAMRAFMAVAGLSGNQERRKLYANGLDAIPEWGQGNLKLPKTVVAGARLLTAAPSAEDFAEKFSLPVSMKLSHTRNKLKSLRSLEEAVHSGQAFVVQNPDKFSVSENDLTGLKLHYGDRPELTAENVQLLRRLETDLFYAYAITMATQVGAPNHIGRSHMVEKSYYKNYGRWHADFSNMGLTGDVETEAYRLYKGDEELHEGLRAIDPEMYQHSVNVPRNDFMGYCALKKLIPEMENKFRVSGYGSATSFIDRAYRDPEDSFYELAKAGAMLIDGGGVRSAMLGMREGVLRAHEEGYRVLNLGIRSETDVSPLEGNIEDWIHARGFEYQVNPNNSRHLSYLDGQMHILKLDRLLQRQEPIAALPHLSMVFAGGKGTVVENALARLHNARVKILGVGLFDKRFVQSNVIIPVIQVDHQFDYLGKERGLFDVLNEPYTKAERQFFEQQTLSKDEAVEFAKAYAMGQETIYGQTLDFVLNENDNKRRTYVHGANIGAGVAATLSPDL